MTDEFIFCDQCIKDITNKLQLKENDNIFCSKSCKKSYDIHDEIIEYDRTHHPCSSCGKEKHYDYLEKPKSKDMMWENTYFCKNGVCKDRYKNSGYKPMTHEYPKQIYK